ncbi:lipoprotein-releasing ABC transporter ATP-binding protein LolD [Thiotrichales bacterium 19S3-7]|nr:lipoprotein-releasing ABC transporter ATP-binding protein LolD [Thiotrichales bacterium 19S3-7]MCF6802101.1 lipoprotein-releasing ABC transporter ATP-binding protein LolD [Thiotrichales bacterium 19S3-11]
MSNGIILSCENLKKSYKEGKLNTSVLHGVNFEILKGQLVSIVGTSGSGKSTFLHLLGGLDQPTEGNVFLNAKPFAKCSANKRARLRNQHLGFVYQFHHLLPEFSALENVAMPLLVRKSKISDSLAKAKILLNEVGLSHRIEHKPSELSGGERQRVAIARALVNDPQCVLADEPTGNLDEENAQHIEEMIYNLAKQKHTAFLIVTHDNTLAHRMDKCYRLTRGYLEV